MLRAGHGMRHFVICKIISWCKPKHGWKNNERTEKDGSPNRFCKDCGAEGRALSNAFVQSKKMRYRIRLHVSKGFCNLRSKKEVHKVFFAGAIQRRMYNCWFASQKGIWMPLRHSLCGFSPTKKIYK